MKETFDRSKFKGAKLSTLKETKEEAEKTNVRLLGGGDNTRPGFHSTKEKGKYQFRIMPAHDPINDPSYQPFRSTMLDCELPEYNDRKETGKLEIKKKRIFIATVHGTKEVKALRKDPIELYIKYVSELAGLYDDKDERQKFLAPITGYRKNGDWIPGIMPSTSFVCYALKDGKLGRLELYDKWVKEMDKIAAKVEEEEDEPMGLDPFSNPDEGYPLTIDKKKALDNSGKEINKWEYDIDRVMPKKRQSWDDFCEEHKVTDEQLKELSEKESLKDLYVNVYTKRDFELALNGLQLFDKKYKYGIFENDEFVKEIKEIEAVVPEPKKDDTSDIEDAFDKKKQSAKDWDEKQCKRCLRAYVMDEDNKLDTDAYLDVIQTLELKELQSWCVLVEKGKKLPELESEDEQPDVKAPEGTEVQEESTEEDELAKLTSNRRRRS